MYDLLKLMYDLTEWMYDLTEWTYDLTESMYELTESMYDLTELMHTFGWTTGAAGLLGFAFPTPIFFCSNFSTFFATSTASPPGLGLIGGVARLDDAGEPSAGKPLESGASFSFVDAAVAAAPFFFPLDFDLDPLWREEGPG